MYIPDIWLLPIIGLAILSMWFCYRQGKKWSPDLEHEHYFDVLRERDSYKERYHREVEENARYRAYGCEPGGEVFVRIYLELLEGMEKDRQNGIDPYTQNPLPKETKP